jgi:hypothetical protein
MQGMISEIFFLNIFFGVPHLAACISLFFYNEPGTDAIKKFTPSLGIPI